MAENNQVELVVKVTDQATVPLQRIGVSVSDLTKQLTGLSIGGLTTVGAAFATVYKSISTVIDATSELQDASFRLDRLYNAFGDTLGVTRGQLADFAEEGARNSRFSNTAIMEMQSTLVKFGSLTGETLKRAQQAALDLGAQMGNLGSAAYIVARSLAAPEQSVRMLRQAGIQLTDAQLTLIKNFEKMGDTAGAANIVLMELEKRYKGTAKADLDTISGSWEHLKNTLQEVAEQKEGLRGLTDVINGLTRALQGLNKSSPEQLADLKATLARYGAADQAGPATADIRRRIAELSTEIDTKDKQRLSLATVRGGSEPVVKPAEDPETVAKKLDELGNGWDELYNKITSTTDAARSAVAKQTDKFAAEELDKQLSGYIDSLQAAEKLQDDILKGFDDVTKGMTKDIDESINTAVEAATKGITAESKNAALVQENLVRNIQNVFANFFINTKGGFRGLLDSFAQMLREMVAQALAAQLTQALIGGTTGGSGLWGSITSGIGSLFGAGSTGATAEMVGLPAGSFAAGGSVSGGLTLVGEEGPELMATGAARFFNARQLAFAGAGGGGMNFAPVTNIVITPKDNDANSLRQEFYAAIDLNNKKQKSEIYTTMQRNGLGRMR